MAAGGGLGWVDVAGGDPGCVDVVAGEGLGWVDVAAAGGAGCVETTGPGRR